MNRVFLFAIGCVALATASHAQSPAPGSTRTAVFAGGCFWCIQPAFDEAAGVIKTVVGYCGGTEPNPTYKLVTSEKTKYRESIEITYDPAKISYNQRLDVYWRQSIPPRPTASSLILDRVIALRSFMAMPMKRKLPRLQKRNSHAQENSKNRL